MELCCDAGDGWRSKGIGSVLCDAVGMDGEE